MHESGDQDQPVCVSFSVLDGNGLALCSLHAEFLIGDALVYTDKQPTYSRQEKDTDRASPEVSA